jgi:hypothetical protein
VVLTLGWLAVVTLLMASSRARRPAASGSAGALRMPVPHSPARASREQ